MCERCYDPESGNLAVYNDMLLCDLCIEQLERDARNDAPEVEEDEPVTFEPSLLEIVWAFERGELRCE